MTDRPWTLRRRFVAFWVVPVLLAYHDLRIALHNARVRRADRKAR